MEKVKKLVNANKVYEAGYTGKGVSIALLDTGVDGFHPLLRENVRFYMDCLGSDVVPMDKNGHGTHIAGIICGRPVEGKANGWSGMAPKASLYVFRTLNEKGEGVAKDSIKALEWILRHHKEEKIALLNFSIGFIPGKNPRAQKKLMELIEALWDDGVLVVAAAGNNGPKAHTVTVPGISKKIVTVGSFENCKYGYQYPSRFSGIGPTRCCVVKPEIWAPGEEIHSLSPFQADLVKKTGTSMSVPIVCGALALGMEKNPNLKPWEWKLLLYESASPMQNYGKNMGWGVLNVDDLIQIA